MQMLNVYLPLIVLILGLILQVLFGIQGCLRKIAEGDQFKTLHRGRTERRSNRQQARRRVVAPKRRAGLGAGRGKGEEEKAEGRQVVKRRLSNDVWSPGQ